MNGSVGGLIAYRLGILIPWITPRLDKPWTSPLHLAAMIHAFKRGELGFDGAGGRGAVVPRFRGRAYHGRSLNGSGGQ